MGGMEVMTGMASMADMAGMGAWKLPKKKKPTWFYCFAKAAEKTEAKLPSKIREANLVILTKSMCLLMAQITIFR